MKHNKLGCTVNFVKVICKECGAEHIVFTRATQRISCPDCGTRQNIPGGGKCRLINCTVKEKYGKTC